MYQLDDMVTHLFHPFKDDLTQHFQDDFQSPYSDFDRHQVVASPKQFEVRTTKWNNFHVETLGWNLQTKKRLFLSPIEEFLFKAMPYPVSPRLGNHRVFLRSLVLSQPSGSIYLSSEDEDEPSSIYGIPLHRWIDHTCGYTFLQDD
jgi:hypothetical protein